MKFSRNLISISSPFRDSVVKVPNGSRDPKRPLNKGQGPSFWCQSSSPIRPNILDSIASCG